MLYIINEDKPGFIGRLGTLLGEAKVNIATFNLGRDKPGGSAIALVQVDQPLPRPWLARSPGWKASCRPRCWVFSGLHLAPAAHSVSSRAKQGTFTLLTSAWKGPSLRSG